jgi:hypothetical protein
LARIEEKVEEVEDFEDSISGMFAVYSIVIEELEWSKEIMKAHWSVSEN